MKWIRIGESHGGLSYDIVPYMLNGHPMVACECYDDPELDGGYDARTESWSTIMTILRDEDTPVEWGRPMWRWILDWDGRSAANLDLVDPMERMRLHARYDLR